MISLLRRRNKIHSIIFFLLVVGQWGCRPSITAHHKTNKFDYARPNSKILLSSSWSLLWNMEVNNFVFMIWFYCLTLFYLLSELNKSIFFRADRYINLKLVFWEWFTDQKINIFMTILSFRKKDGNFAIIYYGQKKLKNEKRSCQPNCLVWVHWKVTQIKVLQRFYWRFTLIPFLFVSNLIVICWQERFLR